MVPLPNKGTRQIRPRIFRIRHPWSGTLCQNSQGRCGNHCKKQEELVETDKNPGWSSFAAYRLPKTPRSAVIEAWLAAPNALGAEEIALSSRRSGLSVRLENLHKSPVPLLVAVSTGFPDVAMSLSQHQISGAHADSKYRKPTIAVASSVLTLTGIAVERYYAIIHPLKVKYLLSKARAGVILALVWVVSVGVATPMLFVHKTEELDDALFQQRFVTCGEKWWGPTQQTTYTIFNLVVLFILPLLTMTSLYIRIAHRLWVQQPVGVFAGSNFAHGNSVRRKLTVKGEVTGLRLDEKSGKLLVAIVQLVAFSNSFNNPVVYAILNENFKKNFMTMLRCGVNRVSPQQVTPNTLQTPMEQSTRSCRLPPQQQI
ncbi:hypothetical protein Bbelb_284520 [Branchiostoma belcheri]|nr:hypothetical protein Bbelb_284520 [Branchiostoma belcheri]